MNKINVVSENTNSTVISEFKEIGNRSSTYQSEYELEKEFIKTLEEQAYERIYIKSEDELIINLRKQLEKLNNYIFTDKEWKYLFETYLANDNDGILEKTKKIQEDYIQTITLDNGIKKNIYLIDKRNIYNNNLQVINQYENEGNHKNRYDVTILVNGLPLIHIELKARGKNIREAFNQIDRYQRDSFWADSGLYEYIQVFVISNGTYTKYYSNTTRDLHIRNTTKKVSNTFEFTSYWADQNNRSIFDLIDFAKTFFSKYTILNLITRYCVFTSDNVLMVMRPYQIVATEKILNKINIAHNYKFYGSSNAGGYIWHTTGSGKTLTSFKTSILASNLDFIDKVIFVVDRKDLDYQTMKEYDKFKKGAANSNTSTKILLEQLEDSNSKIIITTIQKLDNFIKKNKTNSIYNKEVVLIFDECHRSQFGEMHKNITSNFKKYYIFGFTGTPIFAANSASTKIVVKTTEQIFGDRLHTYTIVNAINDKNVLPFKVEIQKTMDIKEDIKDEKVPAIDTEKVFLSSKRINLIANYIIDHYSIKTNTSESYVFNSLNNIVDIAKNNKLQEIKECKNIKGFNSIFAVASIDMAKLYYNTFKNIPNHNLKIALIYSYGVNDEDNDHLVDENSESTENLSNTDRDYLDYAIKDYNELFGTNYDTSSEKFQNYYKDVSLRMKNKEIDILIVVNMFLTGFDAKTLNTLWVDKNLKYHGLIQAFSRTNRILNSVKTYGNIICFRNLEKELVDALSLFGDDKASSVVLLKSYKEYFYGYDDGKNKFEGYKSLIERLLIEYPITSELIGEKAKKEFIKLYNAILKVVNILKSFDQFKEDELLTERDKQDYQSIYLKIYDELKNASKEKVDIIDDIVFEIELIRQIDVNIDYILNLIQQYRDKNSTNKEILVVVNKVVDSSLELRNKKDLIEQFINSIYSTGDVYKDFNEFISGKRKEEIDLIIETEELDKLKTYDFIKKSFENGSVESLGTDLVDLLPPISLFAPNNKRGKKKLSVLQKLIDFFNRYFNISNRNINFDN